MSIAPSCHSKNANVERPTTHLLGPPAFVLASSVQYDLVVRFTIHVAVSSTAQIPSIKLALADIAFEATKVINEILGSHHQVGR